MALSDVLAKLSDEDKRTILVDIAILPTIEEDKYLDEDEQGNIMRAGKKLGFSDAQIQAAVDEQLKALGATKE